jgi:phosphatidylinositol alpha-1,6-mannosyltransferase
MLKSSVDENKFWPIVNKEQIKEKYDLKDAKVILSLARLSCDEEKGQDRVLQALSKILRKIPEVVYVIAGPGSDWRVDELLKDPTLAERVRKLGPIPEKDKNELYNLCDVFVLPSKNEGFGIVFIEALAAGARVIASDGFGCREGLLDGQLGRLVDPDDSESIAEAILDILMLDSKNEWSIRSDMRDESLKIYGYEAWKRCVDEFANEAF